jgi:ATP-dependent 26S proteasome regulatory subunit
VTDEMTTEPDMSIAVDPSTGEMIRMEPTHEEIQEMGRTLMEELAELSAKNDRSQRGLARGNPPMSLDPAGLVSARLEALINLVMPPDTLERIQYELSYQRSVEASLDQAFAEQRSHGIRQGTPAQNGLIIPGRG